MPTPVAHSLAGAATYLAATSPRPREDLGLLAGAVVAACFADLDFALSFLAGQNYHHYFTHSLGFTILFSIATYVVARVAGSERPLRWASVLGAAYLTHVLLDMLSKDTSPPFGVELFWPLSKEFYISPVLVFDDIWRGTLAKLFGLHNWLAVAREAAVLAPIVIAIFFVRRARANAQASE